MATTQTQAATNQTPSAATSSVHPREIINTYLTRLVIFVVVLVAAFGIRSEMGRKKDAPSDTAPAQQKKMTPFKVSAYGNTPRVAAPDKGYTVAFTGRGLEVHCLYDEQGTDDRIFGDPKNPCVEGPILYYYAHSTIGSQQMVSYSYPYIGLH